MNPGVIDSCLKAESDQLPELFRRQTGIPGYLSHGEGIDDIVAGDCQSHAAIRHHRMLALMCNVESQFAEDPNCNGMADTRQLRYGLDDDHRRW